MKAIVLEQFGSIAGLQYKEVAVPVPAAGEVLIKVQYAAVNPYDIKVVEVYKEESQVSLPVIPGSELSGIVEKTGEGVTLFKKGDAVCGNLSRFGGCFATYAIAKEKDIAVIPPQVAHDVACAVPVAALTAWQAAVEAPQLQPGQKILIHGGSGNVGSMAVQLCRSAGAYVVATASGRNRERVMTCGANEFIDYTRQDFTSEVKDADVVLDTIGGKTQLDSFKVLKKGGILISLIQEPPAELALQYGVKARVLYSRPDAARLQKILGMVAEGKLQVFIDTIYPLEQAVQALEQVKKSHGSGKVLLRC